MKHRFEPIEGLWRFHLIYLITTSILGLGVFPYKTFRSFLLLALIALFGIVATQLGWHLLSHIIAFVLGIFTPVVVFVHFAWWQVGIIVICLSFLVYLTRRYLF